MRKKAGLSLHRKKSKRKKTYQWIDTFNEIVYSENLVTNKSVNLIRKPTFSPGYNQSPKHGVKRIANRSPFPRTNIEKTPSKSPSEKRARKCLMNILQSDDKKPITFEKSKSNEIFPIDEIEHLDNLLPDENILQDAKQNIEKEMSKLLPSVFSNLSKAGFDDTLLTFFRQVNRNEFPLSNISFLLWTEVVKWFSCENSCYMRYSEDTKKFWKLGYRMFGGRFVHFMSGYKNTGLKASGESDDINFAVPDTDILRNYLPYGSISHETNSRKPGIFLDIIESLSKSMIGKSCCITFDGKKLKQGLTKTDGDIDLLGFEKDTTLAEKKEAHGALGNPLKDMLKSLNEQEESYDVTNLPSGQVKELKILFNDTLTNISKQVLAIQEKRIKKVYAKEKLIEKSGESNWKNGKYVYAISAIISYIHDIDTYLEDAYAILAELLQSIAYMNKMKYINSNEINLEECEQYVKISNTNDDKTNTRMVKQRSHEWFEARKEAKVTGSTIYKAVGLDGLGKQKEYFDNVVCAVPEKEKSETTKQALQHGTDNEQNATATLVGRVIPILYPDKVFHEEGYVEYGLFKERPFMIISPDGSIRDADDGNSTIAAIELKCPVQNIHKMLPPRYLLQCLSEIEALDVDHLIYLCWKPDISTVFEVKRNERIFSRAFELAERLYGTENPKRCSKLCEETKILKQEINEECNNVQLKFIVPSLKTTSCETNYSLNEFRLTRIQLMIEDTISLYDKFYELNRQPATEAVVFLCCDLNREWKDSSIRSAPVCWFPKGYSLDTETMLKVLETVLCVCKSYGLHIPAISYDGQWHNICVRDVSGEPLTVYQLQKDVWKRVERMPKSEILKEFKSKNKEPKWQFESKEDGRLVIATILRKGPLPKFSPRIFDQRLREEKKRKKESETAEGSTRQQINTVEEDDTHFDVSTGSEQLLTSDLNFEEINSDNIDSSTAGNDNFLGCYISSKGEEEQNSIGQKDLCTPSRKMNIDDTSTILTMMRTDQKCNKTKQWDNKSSTDLLDCFGSAEKLKKMKDCELRIIVRYLNSVNCDVKIKESSTKQNKLLKLFHLFGIEDCAKSSKQKKSLKTYKVKSLKELTFQTISKTYKKSELNIMYAEYVWTDEIESWRNKHFNQTKSDESSPNTLDNRNKVGTQRKQTTLTLEQEDINDESYTVPSLLFYAPAESRKREQNEVHCIDSTHLLTRTRRKCCRGGLEGLTNKPWLKVAKNGKTQLSPAMVDAVVDPMSVSVAISHFSESVEEEMRKNGDNYAGDLCKDIRQWWLAEDNPGIPALKRIHMRMGLRNRLLSHIDFSHFPPPGMYVNGWPSQLWEAIIANIDAKINLYQLCKGNLYNVRAFSSMMGETFFSELTLYDRRGRGTVTPCEFGQFIDSTIEKLNMRLDPSRPFCYRTSRKQVYTLVDQAETEEVREDQESEHDHLKSRIPINDHTFDKPERARIQGKLKYATVSTNRNAVKRGSLGVRWEGARRNESKLLPTVRMGIDLK